jgi:lysozyme
LVDKGGFMRGIDNVVDQLKLDEGLRLMTYRDSLGHLTIGYGCNLEAHPERLAELVNGTTTQSRAESWLVLDVQEALALLHGGAPWCFDLDVVRRGALTNMTYNMGWGDGHKGLSSFKTFLALMQAEKFDAAADDMSQTLWARQVGARAIRLSIQVRTGVWQ